MITSDQGTMIVIGDVFLSVWRRPYTLSALDDISRLVSTHDPKNAGLLTSLALYRFDRIRPADFSDQAVRRRMVELSHNCRYRIAINILDGRGLVNATIRLALSGILTAIKTPYPITTVESIDAGIAAAKDARTDRHTLTTALAALEHKVWPPAAPTAPH